MGTLPEIPTSAIIVVGAGCAALILVLCSVLAYFLLQKADAVQRDGGAADRLRLDIIGRLSVLKLPPPPPRHPTASPTPWYRRIRFVYNIRIIGWPEGKPLDSRRSSMQKEELSVVMENSADRRSTVFATLRSAHNPLESSTSNPAIFSYAPEDFADDNRNTDPYGFEGHYQSRKKRIVYEVVV
uniref:Uncharacterized protein n=1 Tax=Macrostomum lignano TaxID=282301 RepID=A0A1I8F5D2_9PLAT